MIRFIVFLLILCTCSCKPKSDTELASNHVNATLKDTITNAIKPESFSDSIEYVINQTEVIDIENSGILKNSDRDSNNVGIEINLESNSDKKDPTSQNNEDINSDPVPPQANILVQEEDVTLEKKSNNDIEQDNATKKVIATPNVAILDLDELKKEAAKRKKMMEEESQKNDKSKMFNHDIFNALLSRFVTNSGVVNYKSFKNSEKELGEYLKILETTEIDPVWSKEKELAFWINLYNAATIKLILENYPIKSIAELDGGKVWDRKFIKQGASTISLNHIEHNIIRPRFNEPRIHFAVNCAAKSCPPLLNRAYTETNVSAYLARQTSMFINNGEFNKLSTKEAQVSKIFEWYAEDFGHLASYINRFSQNEVDINCKISFLEYDWSLNGY